MKMFKVSNTDESVVAIVAASDEKAAKRIFLKHRMVRCKRAVAKEVKKGVLMLCAEGWLQ